MSPAPRAGCVEPGQPVCGDVLGPVWRAGGETWICERPPGHDGDHWTRDNVAQWVPDSVDQP